MAISAAIEYLSSFRQGLRPAKMLDLDEWQDQNVFLSAKGAAAPGRYRTDRTPFLREIAKALSPAHPARRIVFKKSAQIGASQLMFNWLAYIATTTSSSMLLVEPTIQMAERVSKQRLKDLFKEVPALKEIATQKAKDSGDTILLKEFATGAMLLIGGANSAASLCSMPICFLGLDEVDRYPKDLDGEGSPIALAEERTETFAHNKKIFIAGTPTIEDDSAIDSEFEKSDKRRFFVPCPHCGQMQWLKWGQIIWENDDPKTAKYKCEGCEKLIEERHKTWMLNSGEWVATAKGDGVTVGYHINALYSPVGWTSWASLVRKFLKAKSDPSLLKTFINTSLGEVWADDYASKMSSDSLRERAEDYKLGTAPAGVVVITSAVDVQDNRFEVSDYGWGEGEESWLISHQVIFADPAKADGWAILKEHLTKSIPHETLGEMPREATMIDSGGHHTHEVYQFCRANKGRFYAIKGSSQRGRPIIGRPSKKDVNFKGKVLKSGVELFPIGTDTAKDTIYSRLKFSEPGPSFIHFSKDCTEDFFKQLVAEKKVTRFVKGYPVREWTKKSGERNEALDCLVYAYAGLRLVLNRYNPVTAWGTLKKLAEKKAPKKDPQKPEKTPSVVIPDNVGQQPPPQKKLITRRPTSSFINNW